MVSFSFGDPKNFIRAETFDYLSRTREPATIKRTPDDFIVREPLPEDPTVFLTPGPESDLPPDWVPERTDKRIVRTTMVKERLTTFAAKDWLAKILTKTIGRYISPEDIDDSGLKDRWAKTPQSLTINGVTVDEVLRCTWPYTPGRAGFFLKDVRPASRRLTQGDHRANRFNIKVRLDNMTKRQIEDYVRPMVEKFEAVQRYIPNPYCRQRIGRKQNLHVIGRTLVTGDFASPPGVPPFNSHAEAATYRFLFDLAGNEHPLARETRVKAEAYWLYNFPAMKQLFERVHRQVNLSFEYKIVERLANSDKYNGSFERVIASMRKDTALWAGAWQSYWWNQVLFNRLESWVRPTSTVNGKTVYAVNHNQRIPVLMDTEDARQYYATLPYAREACQELALADRFTRETFLTPTCRNTGEVRPFGPRRRAFIRVDNLTWTAEDGVWTCQFDLPAGAYATAFLGMLFNLVDPDELSDAEGAE